MKKDNNLREILIPAIALFIICIISTALLSYTNSVTKQKIVQVQKEQADKARKLVCPDAAEFVLYEEDGNSSIYAALGADGSEIGYAVTTMDKSYGGDIQVMTGVDMEGKVTGVEILSIDDTPGLGLNAKKESFRKQYIGKPVGSLTVSKMAGDDEIQAITGATRTSEAVTRCVNKAKDLIPQKGGN